MKKIRTYWKIWLGVLAVILVMNGLAFSPKFCDAYTDTVYPYIADGLGRLTARCPVAIGELLMYLGIFLLILALIFLLLLPFLRKKQGYRKFTAGYYKSFLMALTVLVLVYAFTWSVPVRGTVMGMDWPNTGTYSYEDVTAFRQFVYEKTNENALKIACVDGVYQFPEDAALQAGAFQAMQDMAGEFPRLAGYYPPVKIALCSDILDRMSIGGFTYPFTMEMTHSKYSMEPHWQPVLDAHESAHHQGYYKENEADFLSLLALSRSDDPFLAFCGYYDMAYWADLAFFEFPDCFDPYTEFDQCVFRIIDQSFGIGQETYDADDHPIDDMPVVNEVITETADFGWETQATLLGDNIYDGVIALLLYYYTTGGFAQS